MFPIWNYRNFLITLKGKYGKNPSDSFLSLSNNDIMINKAKH